MLEASNGACVLQQRDKNSIQHLVMSCTDRSQMQDKAKCA